MFTSRWTFKDRKLGYSVPVILITTKTLKDFNSEEGPLASRSFCFFAASNGQKIQLQSDTLLIIKARN